MTFLKIYRNFAMVNVSPNFKPMLAEDGQSLSEAV